MGRVVACPLPEQSTILSRSSLARWVLSMRCGVAFVPPWGDSPLGTPPSGNVRALTAWSVGWHADAMRTHSSWSPGGRGPQKGGHGASPLGGAVLPWDEQQPAVRQPTKLCRLGKACKPSTRPRLVARLGWWGEGRVCRPRGHARPPLRYCTRCARPWPCFPPQKKNAGPKTTRLTPGVQGAPSNRRPQRGATGRGRSTHMQEKTYNERLEGPARGRSDRPRCGGGAVSMCTGTCCGPHTPCRVGGGGWGVPTRRSSFAGWAVLEARPPRPPRGGGLHLR